MWGGFFAYFDRGNSTTLPLITRIPPYTNLVISSLRLLFRTVIDHKRRCRFLFPFYPLETISWGRETLRFQEELPNYEFVIDYLEPVLCETFLFPKRRTGRQGKAATNGAFSTLIGWAHPPTGLG